MAQNFTDKTKQFSSIHDSFNKSIPKPSAGGFASEEKKKSFVDGENKKTLSKAFSGTSSEESFGGNNTTSNKAFYRSSSGGTKSDMELEHHTATADSRSMGSKLKINDPYIRYSGLDKKGEYIDKIAEKESKTHAGDGAFFEQSYKNNGKLLSKITLAQGRDRTSTQGVRGRIIGGFRKTGESFETFKRTADVFTPSEEETLDTKLDDKLEKQLSHVYRDAGRQKRRYKAIQKSIRKDERTIKKEIKEHDKLMDQILHDAYFSSSQYSFTLHDGFSNNDIFKTGASSNDIFKNDLMSVNAYLSTSLNTNPSNNALILGSVVSAETPAVMSFTDASAKTNGMFIDDVSAVNKEILPVSVLNARSLERKTMTKQDLLEQKKAQKKAARLEKNKQVRKMAAVTSVSNMLDAKKNLSNEIMGNVKLTGDLIADGSTGLTKTGLNMFVSGAKHLAANVLRGISSVIFKGLAAFGSFLAPLVMPVIIGALPILLIVNTVGAIVSAIGASQVETGEEYELDVTPSDTWVGGVDLTPGQIEEYINKIKENSPLTSEQETAIRFALEAVGAAYDQDSHFNHNDRVFDCSELALMAMQKAGIDVTGPGGASSAAEINRGLELNGKIVPSNDSGPTYLRPGDLIFYNGYAAANPGQPGRHNDISHVAIYIGKIDGVDRMVEAYGTELGVIVSDVRTGGSKKIVGIGRVFETEGT